jgi:ATP-dependent Clp protease ATP-binding subunit ClpB
LVLLRFYAFDSWGSQMNVNIFLSLFLLPTLFFQSIYPIEKNSVILVHPLPFLDERVESNEELELFEQTSPINCTVDPKKEESRILLKANTLEQRLSEQIYGQRKAVKETAETVIRFSAGINDPNTVVGSLLYCGPSGVGKTELARQLCIELYGDLSRLLRIDMSEYVTEHSIHRLIGSPPGYVGYGEGGTLTNFIAKNPYSVVLIDEAEKAHPKILKLFLHVFDNGHLSSAAGKIIDCRKCIFILTSNLAAVEIADLSNGGYSDEEILEFLKPLFMETLSPELFNRMDTVVFTPLSFEILQKLVGKLLNQLRERVYTSKRISLVFDDSLIAYFVSFGIDPKLGARPLKRLVDKQLGTIIAKAIIQGKCAKDATLKCFYSNDHIIVEKI